MKIEQLKQNKVRVDYFELIGGTQYLKSVVISMPNSYQASDDLNWVEALRTMGLRASRVYNYQLLH